MPDTAIHTGPSASLKGFGAQSPRLVPSTLDAALPPPKKRLRANPSYLDGPTSLHALLQAALPGKEAYVAEWVEALRAPSVCISSLEDVKRLDPEDIGALPVPPLVKGIFREVLAREAAKSCEQEAVLQATAARKRAFLQPLRDRNMQPPLAGSKYFQDLKNYKLILTQEEILAGVRIAARRIENWSKGERIILVGILKGAFMFMSDLCRALLRPYSVYFIEASSYGDSRVQTGSGLAITETESNFPISKFVDSHTKAPHKIVLMDELLDNGKTMQEMKDYFLKNLKQTHSDRDILTVCLFMKKRERVYPEADLTAIPGLPDLWLVGYGLDDRGTKRGWPDLFAMPKVKMVETQDKDEVDRLVKVLDDDAIMTSPFSFSNFEISYNHKQKYRLSGLSVEGSHPHALSRSTMPSTGQPTIVKKSDVLKVLAAQNVLKGKYESPLHFAFILQEQSLVCEDAIFSGNNVIYAEMRCTLRHHIIKEAKRLGVEGLGEIAI